MYLYKEKILDAETNTHGKNVNMKAEIGVMYFQAKECQRVPASGPLDVGERHGIDSPSQLSEEPTLLTT